MIILGFDYLVRHAKDEMEQARFPDWVTCGLGLG